MAGKHLGQRLNVVWAVHCPEQSAWVGGGVLLLMPANVQAGRRQGIVPQAAKSLSPTCETHTECPLTGFTPAQLLQMPCGSEPADGKYSPNFVFLSLLQIETKRALKEPQETLTFL